MLYTTKKMKNAIHIFISIFLCVYFDMTLKFIIILKILMVILVSCQKLCT
jgi:hypothetical protein